MAVRPIDGNDFMRRLTLDTSKGHYGEFTDGSEVAFTFREIAAFVEQTPTLTPPNEWVSVYDRLPEPGERVLATDCGFVGEFYINKRGKWQRYNVNCSELLMALDILYWMPLPAPPDCRPPEGGNDVS